MLRVDRDNDDIVELLQDVVTRDLIELHAGQQGFVVIHFKFENADGSPMVGEDDVCSIGIVDAAGRRVGDVDLPDNGQWFKYVLRRETANEGV